MEGLGLDAGELGSKASHFPSTVIPAKAGIQGHML